MTTVGFIAKNALRNKRRALLSILSVAVSLFLFILLQVGMREMTLPVEASGSASRVIARHRISLGQMLPSSQRAIIERIPGVEAVSPFTWYGGKFRGEEVMFAQFGVDPESFLKISTDAKIPPEQQEAFKADRRACIVGKITADKYGLKVGDKMPMEGTYWPYDLDFRIVGIYSGTPDDRNMFFNYKYLDEAGGSKGLVGTWWIRVRSIEEVGSVVDAVNAAFKNTSAEVRAETIIRRGHLADLDHGRGRRNAGEILAADLMDGFEVLHVPHIDVDAADIVQRAAGFLDRRLEIFADLPGLLFDIADPGNGPVGPPRGHAGQEHQPSPGFDRSGLREVAVRLAKFCAGDFCLGHGNLRSNGE